ncbi:amino acid transporter [Cubamyces sp. BRFM 1775]|nr:amino acid transporter [Cubamyces sp. BRFM 1775]
MALAEEKGSSNELDVSKADEILVDVTLADDARLAELGYKGEFRREFSLLETVAFAFSIMNVIGGVSSTLSFGLASGGHVGIVWGWFIPCLFVNCIAASMAELASSMPTSAGLAQMITTAVAVNTDGAVVLGAAPTYGILLGILFTHGVMCSAATKVLARINLFYALIIAGAPIATIIALFVCSEGSGATAKAAFTQYENHTGWKNGGWAFLLSFTAPMWALTGYDSAAHISEEVAGAARVAPIAILVSVAAVEIMGWLLNIAASFATASVPALLSTDLALPMGQLFLDVVGKRGMLAIWSFIIIAQFLCGAAQAIDASRVIFAFARDNALPGSHLWKRVNKYTQTPVNAVWLVIGLSALCGLLGFSATAFSSLAGASVIGLYTSYATPIFLRITSGREKLVPGPFTLGRWFMPTGIIAVAWVAFIVVLLCFPSSQTTNAGEMNYAPVIVLAVFAFAGGSWVFSARRWFTGPLPNIDAADASSKVP